MDAFLRSVLKQGVGFLYREKHAREGNRLDKEAVGTCFFAGRYTPDHAGVYVVTAKHVYNELRDGDGAMFVRLNLAGPAAGVEYVELPESGWVEHPNDQVDLSVLQWFPSMVGAKVGDRGVIAEKETPGEPGGTIYSLPIEVMASAPRYATDWGKSWPPDEGEQVFFVGLLQQYQGSERNYPAFRFGHVALNTDEEIDLRSGRAQYRVIEAQCYKGHSGAPVWAYYQEAGKPDRWAFLGVLTLGFRSEPDQFGGQNVFSYGISAVVPGEYLVEVLMALESGKRN
jgi:hypothetical protein